MAKRFQFWKALVVFGLSVVGAGLVVLLMSNDTAGVHESLGIMLAGLVIFGIGVIKSPHSIDLEE